MRFTTTFTITSFSSVRLSAIMRVSATPIVDSIAFDKVFFQDIASPNAESRTTFALHAITDRNDDVKIVKD